MRLCCTRPYVIYFAIPVAHYTFICAESAIEHQANKQMDVCAPLNVVLLTVVLVCSWYIGGDVSAAGRTSQQAIHHPACAAAGAVLPCTVVSRQSLTE